MKAGLVLAAALILSIHAAAQTNSYTVKNIVTNVQDSRLVNPWGLSRPLNAHLAENEWWVSDQVTGLSTLYDVDGTTVNLAVTIPPATGSGLGSPTGTAFQRTANIFAFATLDGTISVWNSVSKPGKPGANCAACHVTAATIMVNHSSTGASYQGLTIAPNPTGGTPAYYVANANGGVEAYDAQSFSPITFPQEAFTDSKIPLTYSPAGIQAFGPVVFVTYNAIAGGGTGYVDAYDNAGKLLVRLERGFFNQPWGVALSPSNFGKFSNMILVGNTGNGLIGAYKLDGIFQGFLNENGKALALPGLWGLEFGDGNTQSGPANVLYFNAGGPNLTTGVFGAILAN